MVDLTDTIKAKSDQLNADDITDPITITVTGVSKAVGDQPISISYQGDNGKPYKPCKSMRRVLVHVWGKDGNKYVGQSMTLYRDPTVKFGGMEVGGIRISKMTGLTSTITLALTASKANKKPYMVEPLTVAKQANTDELRAQADEHFAQGMSALEQWFNGLTVEAKKAIKPYITELKNKPIQEEGEIEL